jgi:predicted house-cleaning noncanonical NTP pyrophosphatase (MazG superfamily)
MVWGEEVSEMQYKRVVKDLIFCLEQPRFVDENMECTHLQNEFWEQLKSKTKQVMEEIESLEKEEFAYLLKVLSRIEVSDKEKRTVAERIKNTDANENIIQWMTRPLFKESLTQ